MNDFMHYNTLVRHNVLIVLHTFRNVSARLKLAAPPSRRPSDEFFAHLPHLVASQQADISMR